MSKYSGRLSDRSVAVGEYKAVPTVLADGERGELQLDTNGNLKNTPAASLMAQKVTVSGNDTYVGLAPAGTAQATAGWMAYKVAVSGSDTTITWADGNNNYDNVATDLTALTYS